LVAKLEAVQSRHGKAVDEQDLRAVFRANLEFHRVLFAACGNPYLAEQIQTLASRAHAIRFHAITDDKLLDRARREHVLMIDYLKIGDREKLVNIVGEHIKPSMDAYLRLASTRWADSRR
jgi:DNA-binding GntR family transcriptional regulator